jgi:oxaloacetate decarboxylase gamma subunit
MHLSLYSTRGDTEMTIAEMLGQSGILTVLGMAVVFIFLWIMIILVSLAGKLVHILGLDKDEKAEKPAPRPSSVKPEVTAVITASVAEYQKDHG